MARFEVTFSIFEQNEPGKASIGSTLTTNLKQIVEATNSIQARKIVEAQYGSLCRTYGASPR